MNNAIFATHLFSCFFMTGIIWLIQLIHYPAFRYIEASQFLNFQKFHTSTITFIVGPMMTLELFTGAYLLTNATHGNSLRLNFVGILLIWLVTFTLSVPSHTKLTNKFEAAVLEFLIRTNWLRTFFWTARSGLLIYLAVGSLDFL